MAMRYSKCHTLPFPSYDLTGQSTNQDSVSVTWRNGPLGASSAITTKIEYAVVGTGGTSQITVAGTATSAVLTFPVTAPVATKIRLFRENPIGKGEWTDYLNIDTATGTA